MLSNTCMNRRISTFLALIVAFVMALALIVTPTAFATATDDDLGFDETPSDGPGASTAQSGNINTDQKGTLFVHKYSGPVTGAENDGTYSLDKEPEYPVNKPLAGIVFTIYKVNGVDLTTAAGWDELKKLHKPKPPVVITDAGDIKNLPGVVKGDKVKAAKTDDSGTAFFDDLPVGAYIVVETDNSKAKYFDPNILDPSYEGEPVKVKRVVKPFIVTVPFPVSKPNQATPNGWLYNVHVFPKNELQEDISKKLVSNNTEATDIETADNPQDNATRLSKGGELEWKITASIPSKAKPFKKFLIYDNLENGTVGGDTAPVVDAIGSDTFTATGSTPDYTVNGTDKAKVEIEFTQAGLAKLDKHRGEKLSVTLHAKVKEDLTADPNLGKVVKNSSYGLTYKVGDDPEETVTPPPEQEVPIAYFGDFYLKKVSAVPNDNTVALKDAVFSVFATKADAVAGTNALKTGLKSNDKGIVAITDLFRGDTAASERHYWVKETAAPAGFKLNDTPMFIKVTNGTGKTAQLTTGDKNFQNTPVTDVPDLPLTGASGKLLLTLGGLAIVLFAVGTIMVTRGHKD